MQHFSKANERELTERVNAAAAEEAWQQAQAEGLTLRPQASWSASTTGYHGHGVRLWPSYPHLYQARVERGGKKVALGGFATAEEAALHVARSPEGRAAAQKEAAAGSGSQPKRRRLKCPFVK